MVNLNQRVQISITPFGGIGNEILPPLDSLGNNMWHSTKNDTNPLFTYKHSFSLVPIFLQILIYSSYYTLDRDL